MVKEVRVVSHLDRSGDSRGDYAQPPRRKNAILCILYVEAARKSRKKHEKAAASA